MASLRKQLKALLFGNKQPTKETYLKKTIDSGWAYIEFTLEGNVITANDMFVQMLGYSSLSNIEGKHHSIFCEKEYVQNPDYLKFWTDLTTGKISSGEFPRVAKDGSSLWLNASYTPVIDQSGKVLKVIKIASNVTEMVVSRERANSVKLAVDTGWSMIEFTPEGTIIDANSNFLRAFGYKKEAIIGLHHSIFCEEGYTASDDYKQFWKELANGSMKTGEFKRLSKDKTPIWIYASYTPIKNSLGEVFKVFKISSDVSASVKTRMRLKLLLGKIDDLSVSLAKSSIEVSGKTQNMKTDTEEMSVVIAQISQGAQSQAKQVDEISNLLNDVLTSANHTTEKARIIRSTAEEGSISAQKGKKTIDSMVESIRKIRTNSETSNESIKGLISGSNDISKAINVIFEISARTNLLALNAAIEASKAGDAGKGFAVVADEIRKLAEGTKNHTLVIKKVIEKVQKNIEHVAQSIDDMDKSIKAGETLSIDAQSALDIIEQSSRQTFDKSAEIEETASSQRESTKDTTASVEKIVIVSEETALETEQINDSSKNISKGMDIIAAESHSLSLVSEELLKMVKETNL